MRVQQQRRGQSQHPAPISRRELAAELWRIVASRFDRIGLHRVRRFLEIFAGDEALTGLDPRQRSAPGVFFPGLEASPWHDPARMAGVRRVLRFFPEIRRDYVTLRQHRVRFLPYEQLDAQNAGRRPVPLDVKDDVKVFPLHRLGEKSNANLDRCPGVRHALRGDWFGHFSFFSTLEEGHYVGPHSDRINYALTCHLGIRVPTGAGIRVGGETSWWEEGQCLVFDPSFVHEVWNDGPGERTVLLFDAWHPGLTSVETAALRIVRPRIREWEQTCPPQGKNTVE